MPTSRDALSEARRAQFLVLATEVPEECKNALCEPLWPAQRHSRSRPRYLGGTPIRFHRTQASRNPKVILSRIPHYAGSRQTNPDGSFCDIGQIRDRLNHTTSKASFQFSLRCLTNKGLITKEPKLRLRDGSRRRVIKPTLLGYKLTKEAVED